MGAHLKWMAAAFALLAGAAAASGQTMDPAKRAAAAQNHFGLRLLSEESKAKSHDNVFISPLSIFLALAMTENGAAGQTRTAMRETLAIPADWSEDDLEKAAATLSNSLRQRPDVELSIANALWADRNFHLADDFVKRAREYYDADATSLNFHEPEAAGTINAWVSEHTKGKIPAIVTPAIVRTAVAILTNAVYFRGLWREPFDTHQTRDEPFHRPDGSSKTVPMMHRTKLAAAYRSGDGYEAARLPYRASGIAMYAILPVQGTRPEQVMGRLSVSSLIHSGNSAELDLGLPRFTLSYDTKLKDPLERMGMGIAFRFPGADFTPMGSSQLYIGQVLHKSRLEVDEAGTVAAAATAVVMRPGAVLRAERKSLVFDRPFGVILCDEQTEAILFAGVVYDPGR